MMTPEHFKQIVPSATKEITDLYFSRLCEVMELYEINTPKRIASFLSQILHESGDLRTFSENLNYSAQRLLQIFPKYFTAQTAEEYKRQPQKIANRVYANRMGNGDEASGDGWKFRGKGPIQITGHDNTRDLSIDTGIDFVSNPELILYPDYLFLSAGWYWKKYRINIPSDLSDTTLVRKKVNGGTIGLQDTESRYSKYLTILTK